MNFGEIWFEGDGLSIGGDRFIDASLANIASWAKAAIAMGFGQVGLSAMAC